MTQFPPQNLPWTSLGAAIGLWLFAAGAGAQADFTLSASLQVDKPSELLFPGQSCAATLEVIAHPIEANTWSGVKLRFLVVDSEGEKLISSSPVSVRVTRPGNQDSMSVSLNRWYYASYLRLSQERRELPMEIQFRRAAAEPAQLVVEVDSTKAEAGFTAPLELRCSDLDLTDGDRSIDEGDTAWITHKEDETSVTQLMPRLVARMRALPEGLTVHWQFQNRYERRKGLDDRKMPAEGWRELPGEKSWDLGEEFGDEFFGGESRLSFRVADAKGETLHEGSREFTILSRNPSDSTARKIIARERGPFWFAEAVSRHESRQGQKVFNQFNTLGRVVNQPNYGAPDAWGLFQIDSARGKEISSMEAWDWRSNVQAGIEEFQKGVRDTKLYLEALQRTYPEKYEAPPSHYTPPGCKTKLTFEEASILQLYNGASVVKKLKTQYDTLSFYRGAYQFFPGNPSGQRWKFIPNKNDYVRTVLKNEVEGGMSTRE